MRRALWPLFLLLLAGCSRAAADAPPDLVTEDFAREPSSKYWFVCHRPENSFKFGEKVDGRTAMVATDRPERGVHTFRENHVGCVAENGDYERDGDERAEVWESNDARVPLGTDVWYRFDMFVDDSLNANSKRFVSGQWKTNKAPRGGPLVAQRFTGRRFTVTVEQDNVDPKRKKADVLCRVLVADQLSLEPSPAGWPHDDKAKDVPPRSHFATLALAPETDAPKVAKEPGCADKIVAKQYHVLPDPFGRWTTMVYHLSLRPDGKAFLEIWADGLKIARVDGKIGYKDTAADATQYFKFGPYRDPEGYETVTKFANYARSTSRKDVDPTGKLSPE